MGDVVERLREVATEKRQEAWSRIDGGQDLSIGADLAEEAAAAIEARDSRIAELEAELSASLGYMLNAKIDLDTGAPKRTAMATLEGGIRRVRTALPTPPKGADQ